MDRHEQSRTTGLIPRYAGEDTRLTSKKELWGWYSYGFAAEVFVVCGIGIEISLRILFTAPDDWICIIGAKARCY